MCVCSQEASIGYFSPEKGTRQSGLNPGKKKEEKGKEPKDLGRSSRPGESIKYIPDMSKRRRKRRNGWTAAAESIVV